jgi:ATP-dependent protease ClpP protease subunit
MAVNLARLRNLAEQARAKAQQSQQTRDGRSWYRIENAAAARAEVYLYDLVGEWGITAQDFVNDLRGVRSQGIDLHLNCEGGEVFDGLAIYESLRQHPADVTVHVDGLAASAASFIAMAGDRIVMAERARMMIHDAHGLVIGNAADMREMASLLDDLSDNIADIYAERAGGTRAQWRQAMRGPTGASDGTWYDAQAAVDAGLADEVATRASRSTGDEPANTTTAAAPTLPWDSGALLATLHEATRPLRPALAWNPSEFAAVIREVAA